MSKVLGGRGSKDKVRETFAHLEQVIAAGLTIYLTCRALYLLWSSADAGDDEQPGDDGPTVVQ